MKEKRNKMIACIVLVIIAFLFLLPLIWVILASFDTNASLSVSLPNFTVNNYKEVLTSKANLRSFGNGLILSLCVSVLVVVLAVMAAYPLSRYEMKHKKLFMVSMLFMTSLPITTVMVPVYKVFVAFGLYDNIGGIILFMSASSMPYAIWMIKNFMDAVPVSLEEAAWVDGAGRLKGIIRVIMPLMLPGVFTIAIFTFSGCWGNFFVPFILLSSSEKYPASIMLYQFFGQHSVAYGMLSAYSIIYAIPSILLYVITQRWMSKGFSMSGADKG
jgi:ABC-type sugar transport system, permease component